jgi:AraC family transcriptional regulator of adaptative response / DNA-3-methyladenine glycosylase II
VSLDPDLCYRALRSRDARFDGRFFTCVRTTGIYCRPICPAPAPKRENCVFLPSAAAALDAGFRPCLRCRPEASPDAPAWSGTGATVTRALRLITEGALDASDVASLAARLGVGDRHLRRLFDRHVGASPVAVANARRLALAKQLLEGSSLRLSDVAAASGFGSVRRFHDAVRGAYHRAPREMRRARAAATTTAADGALVLRLPYRPPYPFRRVLAYLAPRAIPGVEVVLGDAYLRSVDVDGARGVVEVRAAADADALVARLRISRVAALGAVASRLRRVFDLDADPAAIAEPLARDPLLAPLLRAEPGIRVPGAFDPFELAVRAVLGQQVSVAAATTLAGRLVTAHGPALDAPGTRVTGPGDAAPCRLFPSAATLARADLRALGLPRARTDALRALAEAVAADPGLLSGARGLDDAVARLAALPGLGPWTAHYVAMRALREPDAFPASDLGLRRAFGRLAGLGEGALVPAAALERHAEAWRPWRAYAAMALWGSLAAPSRAKEGSR